MEKLSFEERLKQKSRSGYDHINSKETVLLRKQDAEKLEKTKVRSNRKM